MKERRDDPQGKTSDLSAYLRTFGYEASRHVGELKPASRRFESRASEATLLLRSSTTRGTERENICTGASWKQVDYHGRGK